MSSDGFDFEAFRAAVTAKDAVAWSGFYADDAEWVEYKPSAPPCNPVIMRGRAEISQFLRGVAGSPIELDLGDEVLGPERAAFCLTCTLPDGRRIVENVIVHVRDGKIARQVDVEAWD